MTSSNGTDPFPATADHHKVYSWDLPYSYLSTSSDFLGTLQETKLMDVTHFYEALASYELSIKEGI